MPRRQPNGLSETRARLRTIGRMLRLVDLRERPATSRADIAELLPRAVLDSSQVAAVVRPILADVAARGTAAVLGWGQRLDGVAPPSLRVPASVIAAAEAALPDELRNALAEMITRTRLVHLSQLPASHTVVVSPGGSVTQRWIPVQRVGLYVPGGRAVYPSSVVMNVVPAQVAGVSSIAITSPPRPDNDGWPHPTILAAARMLGVDEVYAAGGAQAIAMFAYGAGDGADGDSAAGIRDDPNACAPVDVVTGPGNQYVAAAKRILQGKIGIDSDAGPTEIAILADETADARLVAADLVSQAEHDPLAAAVLITPCVELIEAVNRELAAQVARAEHRDRISAGLSGQQSAAVLVVDLDQGIAVANDYAAEHLEIQTSEPAEVVARITNAGAIFVGPCSPVPLGDYLAGSNHVLPTAATARFSSGLSVDTFLRRVQVIEYNADALRAVRGLVSELARAEDLPAHAVSVDVRFDARFDERFDARFDEP